MLGTPVDPPVLVAKSAAVKIREVRAISRKGSAKKKRDFSKFKELARLIQEGRHHRRDGVEEVLRIRRDMNDGGKRRYSDDDVLGRFENPQRPYAGPAETAG